VLATSLGVAVFPLLSRYAARGDVPALRDSLNRALRLAFMEGLATGVGLLVLAEPIMRLIFVRGRFTPEDAARAADILRMYVLGMWAFCGYQVVTRAFYALKDPKTPMKVSCAMAGLYMLVVLTLVWVPGLGPRAFGLAAALTFSLNVLLLAVILRRRLGRLGGRKLAVSAARSAVACAAMAGAVLGLKRLLAGQANWLVVAACVPAGAGVFLGAARLLRCPELAELRGRAKGEPPYNEPKDPE
jgi:putative peptidoglycan lipid II flippase